MQWCSTPELRRGFCRPPSSPRPHGRSRGWRPGARPGRTGCRTPSSARCCSRSCSRPAAVQPRRRELVALAALVALAGWEALSITWSAVPPLARDEAFLTLFYAIALARAAADPARRPPTGCSPRRAVAAVAGLLALGAGLVLWLGSDQIDHFYSGRLSFPISYPNAEAAVFLIGFWPAVVFAAQRGALAGRAHARGRQRRPRSRPAG